MKDLKDYYTVKDAAVEIGIAYEALHQRIYRKTVIVERIGDRVVLIHKDEVSRLKREVADANS